MRLITLVVKQLSICKCEYPLFNDNVTLGKEYEVLAWPNGEPYLILGCKLQCGGCKQQMTVDLVCTLDKGSLPYQAFVENESEKETLAKMEYNLVPHQIESICGEVAAEVNRAITIHPSMPSAHHGHSVAMEELTELFEEIREKKPNKKRMRIEAIQLAATAVRFVLDVCDNGNLGD